MKALKLKNIEFLLIIKGALCAVCISLVGILLFALLIRFANVSDNLIMPINQVIKIASIFIGCVYVLKSDNRYGAKRGALIGLVYSLLAYVVFSVLSSSFTIGLSTLYDILFSTVAGLISGIIAVNLRKY